MRAAVIGVGHIAKQHIRALKSLPHVDVVGICDLSPVMAESTAERFGIPYFSTDVHELLTSQTPDIVHVTTPVDSHYQIAMAALNAGCHVFVEKPIVPAMGQLIELIECAAVNRLCITEDHNYRFNHSVSRLRRLIDDGDFGAVRHVEIQLCLDVFGAGSRFADRDLLHPALRDPLGIASDFLTHLCYLAHSFIGPHQELHVSLRSDIKSTGKTKHENFQAFIVGRDATASIGCSTDCQPDAFRLRLQGTRMSAETNLFETGIVVSRAHGGPRPLVPVRNYLDRAFAEAWSGISSLHRKLSGGPGAYEGLWELIQRTYAAIDRGLELPVTISDITEVNCMIHTIRQRAVA